MPQGEKLVQLEREKGIVVRFMIGHSATSNSILDRAIDSEDSQHKDFLRLEHVEGYHELSAKTKTFFSTAVAKWDAEFYVKVDDDVHVNLGMLASTLARHRSKPRVYIGCMKSGPVLAQKNVKYHEPEYWKFGEEGNKYFRHATGQIYAISKELATYISLNQPILHKYANEDVSLGAWFIGLEVEHIDDHSMCCGTPPDCAWKAQAGEVCVASFDWSCSGICKSVERIKFVHEKCGEGDGSVFANSEHGFDQHILNLVVRRRLARLPPPLITFRHCYLKAVASICGDTIRGSIAVGQAAETTEPIEAGRDGGDSPSIHFNNLDHQDVEGQKRHVLAVFSDNLCQSQTASKHFSSSVRKQVLLCTEIK
ncbi:BETA-13-N-ACETYLGLUCOSAMINYLTRANSFERASE [Salix viminalis]|uniref:Hexosyltransferase n=1 Tax=Salix viminalis TaxID=40686 RepID=A0A9Q0UID6_SALVM|nr:BETA-13-N-ACETYLGLUCOSAMINYLTRANSFERASE [Salix viminalis]